MPKKVLTPEQIVAKLREIEVALAHGKSVSLACRDAGIVDAGYSAGARNTVV
jgi:putative transposase